MSKWCTGKLNLKCSIDVLRRALIGIHPEWESHLEVDPNGTLPLYRYQTTGKSDDILQKGFHIVIPGGRHGIGAGNGIPTRSSNNDWGFKRIGTDQWEVVYGDFGKVAASVLQESVKAKVFTMKGEALAKIRGWKVLQHEDDGEEEILDLEIPKNSAKELHKA